jgi:hypothetical protein
MGAVIDVEKGTMKFTSPPGNHHDFLKVRAKVREVDARHLVLMLLRLKYLILTFCA